MAAIPTSSAQIRAGLLAEIDRAADTLSPVQAEALRRAFVPFAEFFCEIQEGGGPDAGRMLSEATASTAAAIIAHLHLNAAHSVLDRDAAALVFANEVHRRVLLMLAKEAMRPADGGRWQ